MSQGTLATHLAWQALVTLLTAQLPAFNVAAISDRDFNEAGEIIMDPPSIRIFFAGEVARATSDSQRLSYEVEGRYGVLCADQDLSSVANQAFASATLLDQVKSALCGARLLLADGETTEPVQWVNTEPLPVDGIGVAYSLGFVVPGLAQFAGTNAQGVA